MNAIIEPSTYDRYKLVVIGGPFLLIDGVLQNQDGVIVKVGQVEAQPAGAAAESHIFIKLDSCWPMICATGL
jgi:hypothetical protein